MAPPQRVLRELLVTRTKLEDIGPGVRVREGYFIWTNPENGSILLMELFDVLDDSASQEGLNEREPRRSPASRSRDLRERMAKSMVDPTNDGILLNVNFMPLSPKQFLPWL